MPLEFGTVRVTVPPGYRSEDVEFPGPGLYEAVFDAPSWLVVDFNETHHFTFTVAGHKIEPLWTRFDHVSKTLVFRLRIHSNPETFQPDTLKNPGAGRLTLGNVIRGYGDHLSTWILQNFIQVVMDHLREIRKILEVPTAAVYAAAGLLVVGAIR